MIFVVLLIRLVLCQDLGIPGWNLNITIDLAEVFDENASYYGIIKDYEGRNETWINPYANVSIPTMPNNHTIFDFDRYPRWELYNKYRDLSFESINREESSVSDGLNSWLHSADRLYQYGNKELVVEAFKHLKVFTSTEYNKKKELEDVHIHLANSCELENINEMSIGTLYNIFYRFWNRNDSTLAFWNETEFAIYEMEDSWLDCRRQSLNAEYQEGLKSAMKEKMAFVEGMFMCHEMLFETDIFDQPGIEIKLIAMKSIIRTMHALWDKWDRNQDAFELDIKDKTPKGKDILGRVSFSEMGGFNLEKLLPFNITDVELKDWDEIGKDIDVAIVWSHFEPRTTCPEIRNTLESFDSTNDSKKVTPGEVAFGLNSVIEDMTKMFGYYATLRRIPEQNMNLKLLPSRCEIDRDYSQKNILDYGGTLHLKIASLIRRDGQWDLWGQWSSCSATCSLADEEAGSGMQTRSRKCGSPAPANGGFECGATDDKDIGDDRKEFSLHNLFRKCYMKEYSDVDADVPEDSHLEVSHSRFQSVQARACKSETICQAVDGEWGSWNGWTDCSRTCGYGLRATTRYCNSPFPSREPRGRDCLSSTKKEISDSGIDEDEVQFEFKEEKCILENCPKVHYEHQFKRDHESETMRKVRHVAYQKCSSLMKVWDKEKFQACMENEMIILDAAAEDRKDFMAKIHVEPVFEDDEEIKDEKEDKKTDNSDYAESIIQEDYFRMLELSLANEANNLLPNEFYFLPFISLMSLFNKMSLYKST